LVEIGQDGQLEQGYVVGGTFDPETAPEPDHTPANGGGRGGGGVFGRSLGWIPGRSLAWSSGWVFGGHIY
jgi:hypothetical protein